MRAIILGRVSTDEQAEEGYGLAVQLEACHQHILQRGYTTATSTGYAATGMPSVPGAFLEDYTGKTALRPGITALFEAIKPHRIELVVIHRTDRLGRKARVQDVLEEEFAARGIVVEYVTGSFDTTNRYGRAMR